MRLQEFVNPFCEEAENSFFQPNPTISEIAGNLRLKLNTNVSFRVLCCVFAYLRKLNLPWDSESEKRISSRSCVWIYQSEWELTLYWEISASRTKTHLPNRTVFNVCIQRTELNWCVFAGVCKPFSWRSGKRIFSAKSKHFRNSCKAPSKTQNGPILQSALLCVRLPKWVESALRFREWEARFFQELGFVIPGWIGTNAVLRNICF